MSDEVSDFLRSVELLKERREEEDDARSRELEEKILQDKRERQARRAERARSISPQKSSPANTPSPTSHRVSLNPAADGIGLFSPDHESSGSPRSRPVRLSEAMDSATDFSDSPTKENDSVFDSDAKRTSQNSSSTTAGGAPRSPLSWQRRPPSRGSDRPKSRPLSTMAVENAARSSTSLSDAAPAEDETMSRSQIAQSLAGKDPTWFRQTADRGQGSAAYRRTLVEEQNALDLSALRGQLPGMTRDGAAEAPRELPQPPRELPQPTATSPPRASTHRFSKSISLGTTPRLDPPTRPAAGENEPPSMTRPPTTPGRTSPTRTPSPTKGMGGFVQSAMMKRSDSVKRWSVTSPGGLQRADSVISNRPSADSLQRSATVKSPSRPSSALGDGSTTPTSKPASRPSSRPTSSYGKEDKPDYFTKAPATEGKQDGEKTPPVSPSKTMDPRRWSPNKASWLETALNKPESPKPKPTPANSTQPAWMVELNKVKTHKTGPSTQSPSVAAVPKKPEVKPSGLLRTTPMGSTVKPVGLGLFPGVPATSPVDKPSVGGFRGNLTKASSRRGSEDPGSESQGASDDGSAPKMRNPPSVKDLRANLKPRAPPPGTSASGQPDELKNVFGKLRKATTQNYVAPDELKGNILRGKASLTFTGGPKKTERVDEFKEAILKKKDDFKKAQLDGRSVSRTGSVSSETPIPEGVAKRLEIQRTGSRHDLRTAETPLATPSVALQKEVSAPGRLQGKVAGGLADRFNPALAGMLARGPPAPSGSSRSPDLSISPRSRPAEVETPGPGPQLTHMTKGRARGPKRKAPTTVGVPAKEPVQAAEAATPARSKPQSPRAPAKPASPVPAKPTSPRILENPTSSLRLEKPATPPKPSKPFPASRPDVIPLVDSRRSLVHERSKSIGNVISLVDSSRKKTEDVPMTPGRPIAIVDTPIKTRPRSPTKVHEQVAALAAKAQQSKPAEAGEESPLPPSSPRKLDMKRMSKFIDEQKASSPAPEPTKSRPASPTKERPASPPKEPSGFFGRQSSTRNPEPKPLAPLKSGGGFFGGIGLGLGQREKAPEPEQAPQPPLKSARPLPQPPSPTRANSSRTPITSPARSPTKYGQEVSTMLADFFGDDRPKRAYTADTADILSRRPAGGSKVQTQGFQLFQFFSDGKKVPVPAHYERVLFEREMYLCAHTFVNAAGKKVSEVYFWAGDEVPQAAIDDALMFAQREARNFGGKLVKLVQGKETSEFLQALGGIVIVRRGSSNKYDSLASNMLCGRRYIGQIVFDEVDFAPSNLCSGFPYLITQQGKCYLWKGKGSDVDELGCARLVGMDLALMGELTEVDEGREPPAFWDVFDGCGARAHSSADHWRLKPNYDRYCGRLFCSSADARQQQQQLAPFKQTDLLPTNIYVLDAFFELYIIVGKRSQHQYAAFHNALDFAQEYAILAAGMEDRPFVPISTVVLEGIPRDLKAVFRKWDDAASPTVMGGGSPPVEQRVAAPPPLKRGRSLRIVPLGQALQALSD
ncbi:hypothetical protein QBC39DRAFT_258296 [Podospora conica]|nr:hypothetical protein QBC39DRAFT_258296 [Schizothecium conicum]